eukprot:14209646-Ditylum_brightwellii.AAC.1
MGYITSFRNQGWVKPKSGLVKRILKNPGVSKRGQIILICHQDQICPCTYVHHHKLWDRPTGFTEGKHGVRMTIDKLDGMIIGEGDEQLKKIFTKRPVITWDNYFSGNTIFGYAKGNGFGLLTTLRWERLPKGVPLQCFHNKPTDTGNSAANCACYNESIVMGMNKEDPETLKTYQKAH